MSVQYVLLYITTLLCRMLTCMLHVGAGCFTVRYNKSLPDVLTLCSNMSVPNTFLFITTSLYRMFLKPLQSCSAHLRLCLRRISVHKYLATLA